MNLLSARNPHDMLPVALDLLFKRGVKRGTRNGPVLQLPGPTLLEYERPMERVVFWPERDANPFFHLAEAMWMLAGRNDVAYVAKFAKQMNAYSDDGETVNGAYGHRWRHAFGHDQLHAISLALIENKDCRRQVLTMWDAARDPLNLSSKDIPCNTHAYFAVAPDGCIDLTVCNRSNDLVWGCLGANAVHFSVLLEYMASETGRPPGRYYQFTNNLHGYLATIEPLRELPGSQGLVSPYEIGNAEVYPIDVGSGVLFAADLEALGSGEYHHPFFVDVVGPMEDTFMEHRKNGPEAAAALTSKIQARDWRLAAEQWLERRIVRLAKASDDGVAYE